MNKVRLDKYLLLNKKASTRSQAQFLIKEGFVLVNDKFEKHASYNVKSEDTVLVKKEKYLSKGELKLAGFLKEVNLDIKNSICMDIGASTGGFVNYLIQHGAIKVYAVDVGTNQLHERLLKNPKIINLENMDIRDLKRSVIKEELDIITVDVSFISLDKIIESIKSFSTSKTKIIILIKPQFEVGKEFVKKGIVKDRIVLKKIIKKTEELLINNGFKIERILPCTLKGKEGNQEYFALIGLHEEV